MWEYPSEEWQNAKKNNQSKEQSSDEKNETILVQKWDCKSVYYRLDHW